MSQQINTQYIHGYQKQDLTEDKNFRPSEMKADDKINVTKNVEIYSGKGRKHCGTGENADYQHLLLFPQCFEKAS